MAIGTGWVDGSWVDAGWVVGAWAQVVAILKPPFIGFILNVSKLMGR